jgi:hypothetical protein
MKKYLPHIDLITLGVAVIGILLRFWHLSTGVDENGLYPANHIAWTLLLCLSTALVIALFLIAGYAGKSRNYSSNFSPSLTGAVGFAVAGCAMLLSALSYLLGESLILYTMTGVLGLLSAAALILGGWCRWKGKRPHFLVFALPCVFFALRLFCTGHVWGDEPELHRYLLRFFADMMCALAAYQLWAFSVNLGNRSSSLLCSLLAVYLCLVAVPGSSDAMFYLAMAIWLFLNLCPKTAAPFRPVIQPEPAIVPEEIPAEPPVQEETDPEIEAIIAQFQSKIDEIKE